MCDYSLHLVASRPANVGDRLVTTIFPRAITRGFAAPAEASVAVCLRPGTELAFDKPVQYDSPFRLFGRQRLPHKTARFRQINLNKQHAHHDALEFPDGKIMLVTRLKPGQKVTVLQLPPIEGDRKDRRPIGKTGADDVAAQLQRSMDSIRY